MMNNNKESYHDSELSLFWQKATVQVYTIDKQASRLMYAWLFFAVSSLIFAGIFAFLLAMSRTPFIQDILQARDYLYTALVTHVILSVVIWFLSFMGILWILAGSAFLDVALSSMSTPTLPPSVSSSSSLGLALMTSST